jgi:hypothetical protein
MARREIRGRGAGGVSKWRRGRKETNILEGTVYWKSGQKERKEADKYAGESAWKKANTTN